MNKCPQCYLDEANRKGREEEEKKRKQVQIAAEKERQRKEWEQKIRTTTYLKEMDPKELVALSRGDLT